HRALLPDTPAVTRTLAQMRHGVTVGGRTPLEVLQVLADAHLLVDVAEQRLLTQARAATRVAVEAPDPWLDLVTTLLRAGGLAPAPSSAGRDLTWIISVGEPDRESHDSLLRNDEPILFTSVFDTRVRVGPFVLPGTTACLRCIDAQSEPWASPKPSRIDAPSHPDDLSGLLLHHALVAGAADLCAWAEGRQPTTWSRSRWQDAQFASHEQVWRRHPHCGCSWADTMTG